MAAVPRTDNEHLGEPDPRVWRISVQYVTDEDGNRTHVIIPNDEFEELLDDLEDLWDLRRYDAAKSNPGEDRDAVPAQEFFDQLDRERGWNTR